MDIFATILSATNTQLPDDRTLDGRDLLPMLTSDAASPHDVIFGQLGAKLSTIRDARWKLHILAPGRMALRAEADGTWRDPRAPDGVTILAPFEQYNLDSPPGPATGVASGPMQLFDLQTDPGEQNDVAQEHPEEAKRLTTLYQATNKEVPAVEVVKRVPIK